MYENELKNPINGYLHLIFMMKRSRVYQLFLFIWQFKTFFFRLSKYRTIGRMLQLIVYFFMYNIFDFLLLFSHLSCMYVCHSISNLPWEFILRIYVWCSKCQKHKGKHVCAHRQFLWIFFYKFICTSLHSTYTKVIIGKILIMIYIRHKLDRN